ncbi:hypothetical protein [Streptomyces sp. NPDC018031]|uniref:hypothetical protein n=1 Tax=Streptomyces sp. NPDC018031 TaxID=3365033 RepID=UPI0037B2EC0D
MPLQFLTADRSADDHAPDPDPLPYDARDRWRRPYRPGPWRVAGAALLLLLASYILFSALIIAMAGALPGAGVCVAVATGVIVLAVRLVRTGVWVSGAGLRQMALFTTTTMAWGRVGAVRTVQQPVRFLGLPRTVQGQAVIVEPAGGAPLRPIITDHNADFLGRPEAFDMAADAIEGWAARHR